MGILNFIWFSRIQNLHISQTDKLIYTVKKMFSRIQNLHISQTLICCKYRYKCLVEFKIYISLKQLNKALIINFVQQNSKFTYLSNKREDIKPVRKFSRIQNLHISQTAKEVDLKFDEFSRIQNLHISQTFGRHNNFRMVFSRIQNLHISQTENLQ